MITCIIIAYDLTVLCIPFCMSVFVCDFLNNPGQISIEIDNWKLFWHADDITFTKYMERGKCYIYIKKSSKDDNYIWLTKFII